MSLKSPGCRTDSPEGSLPGANWCVHGPEPAPGTGSSCRSARFIAGTRLQLVEMTQLGKRCLLGQGLGWGDISVAGTCLSQGVFVFSESFLSVSRKPKVQPCCCEDLQEPGGLMLSTVGGDI